MTAAKNFNNLAGTILGRLVLPDETNYNESRQVWNTRLNRKPAAILQCASVEDAATGVRFANDHSMGIAVRGGGHSYAGLSTADDVLLIDFSDMAAIQIDKENRLASIEPGVRWGDFYAAALPHGLCPVGGTVSSVGVSGFILGGGSGWLTSKHGLGLDNLISAKVVTADGEILTASESENADLFWGIRGGAGNFGIVAEFTVRLHPVPASIFAGQVMYPLTQGKSVLQAYRSVMESAPDGFCCFAAAFRVPPIEAFPESLHGQVILDLIIGHIGDPAEGEKLAQPLRELTEPIMDLCAVQPFADLLKVFDAGSPPGQRWYTRSTYFEELSGDVIDTYLEKAASIQGPLSFAYFGKDGGAASRVPVDATAYPHRGTDYCLHILSGWMDESEDASVMQWTRDFHQALLPHATNRVYVNLLGEDEPDRIRDAYGENFARLLELKQKWDPHNRFCHNQNIRPS